jgi:hypothetical protein
MEKWEVYSLSRCKQFQRTAGYKDGKDACKDFMPLIKTVDDRKFETSKKTPLGTVEEKQGCEQDLEGFEDPERDEKKAKALEHNDMLEGFPDYLRDIYGDRLTVPWWARAEERCPDYWYDAH